MKKRIVHVLAIIALLSLGYANCARILQNGNISTNSNSDVADLASSCDNCDASEVYLKPTDNVANVDGENLNVRQFVESSLSLLGQKKETLSPYYLNVLMPEKELRRALLPQISQTSSVNAMGVLSQTSLAGQVCRVFIYNRLDKTNGGEVGNVPFFENINWSQAVNQVDKTESASKALWLADYVNMAKKIWGRDLTSSEKSAVSEFIDAFIADALSNPAANFTEIGGLKTQTLNMAVLMCVSVLVSPESSLL